MLLLSLMESLEDADKQVRSFVEVQKLTYDAGKKFRGETWDPTADARSRRHFRDFLIAIQSTLDTLADSTALFFTVRIPGLRLGRGVVCAYCRMGETSISVLWVCTNTIRPAVPTVL